LLLVLWLPLSRVNAAPTVVASIAPLHSLSLVAAVMQGVSTPQLLLRGGESPHHFSLRPSDARRLHQAQVLF
jgi:zinc transport system substrate-binding protein